MAAEEENRAVLADASRRARRRVAELCPGRNRPARDDDPPPGSMTYPRSTPASRPAKPLVSYQVYRQLPGWNLPPLVMHALGARQLDAARHAWLAADQASFF
jgi:hypothetical protein